MALKHKLTKEDVEKLPEAVRAEYTEQDGEFYLQVEGMVPKARVDEFRSTNINLMKEKDDLEKRIKAFGEITAEDIEAMQKRIAEGGTIDEEHIEAELAKRVTKLREENEKAVNQLKTTLDTVNKQLSTVVVDKELSQAAVSAGIRDTALQDVVLRGHQTFVVEDGRAVAKARNPKTGELETIYGADGATPQSIPEWLAERATDCPHWFKESTGSGGHGKQGGGGAPVNKGGDTPRGMNRVREVRSQS